MKQTKFPIDKTNNDGRTALFFACSKGHMQVVELLLTRRPNVNLADNAKFVTMHRTCSPVIHPSL